MKNNNTKMNKGSYRERPNGTGELRVSINGKSKSFYGKNEAEVRRNYREYLKQLEDSAPKAQTALEDYAQYYLTSFKLNVVRDSTYDRLDVAYRNHIKGSVIGKTAISDLTIDSLQSYFNDKKNSLSLSSLNKIKEVIISSLNLAVKNELIPKNPMQFVVLPKNCNANVKPVNNEALDKENFYTDEEIKQILLSTKTEQYLKNRKRYRYSLMFLFLLNTGLRTGECLALTRDDVDLENKTARINKTVSIVQNRGRYKGRGAKVQIIMPPKTKNGIRFVPLNETAIQCIKGQLERNQASNITSDLIFPGYKGDLLNMRSVQETFESICNDYNICHRGLHALRHTFGSILIRHKVDIKVVSKILGHSDVKFTYNRYIHIIQQQEAEAVDLICIGNLNG